MLKLHAHACAHNYWLLFHRRQSSRCMQDIQNTTQQPFIRCNDMFERIGNGQSLTRNDTIQFCQIDHCPTYMLSLAENIRRDCGFPDPLVSICKIPWYLPSCTCAVKIKLCILDDSNIACNKCIVLPNTYYYSVWYIHV